ncbi:unnamed protein product [Callosobruchus maculatus]|uniref:Uncharacterized protein n=1 Tax=Callosobruchus maculatus TaxID=64391 RepID=A0A653C125_CALMS|nr:unnamed protein product [Callosobruchus maculatus]
MHNDKNLAATPNASTTCPHRSNTNIFCGKYRVTQKRKNIRISLQAPPTLTRFSLSLI